MRRSSISHAPRGRSSYICEVDPVPFICSTEADHSHCTYSLEGVNSLPWGTHYILTLRSWLPSLRLSSCICLRGPDSLIDSLLFPYKVLCLRLLPPRSSFDLEVLIPSLRFLFLKNWLSFWGALVFKVLILFSKPNFSRGSDSFLEVPYLWRFWLPPLDDDWPDSSSFLT